MFINIILFSRNLCTAWNLHLEDILNTNIQSCSMEDNLTVICTFYPKDVCTYLFHHLAIEIWILNVAFIILELPF